MSSISRRLTAALVALPLLAGPAAADSKDDALAQAEEGLKSLLLALDLIIASIPQYGLPEVMENGDIIIRRVQPEGDSNRDGIPEEEA